jgi:hypothetical protein
LPPPRFSSGVSQFAINTLGTTLPKVMVARSPAQLVEDVFLQLVEDYTICFLTCLSAKHVFGPLFKAFGKLPGPVSQLGQSIHTLSPGGGGLAKNMLGAKAGMLTAALTLMGGVIYYTPFVKNLLSVKFFHTKNFSAIAGLETGRRQTNAGEADPVQLAQRRLLPLAAAMAGGFALAAAAPTLVHHFPWAEKAAKQLLTRFDFGKNQPFELSKPLVLATFVPGLVGYLDSARDRLEKLEIATRLAVVFPYQAIGKEVAGNWLARWFEGQTLGTGKQAVRIRDKVRLIDDGLFQQNSWLDFNRVRSGVDVLRDVRAQNLPDALAHKIINAHNYVNVGSYLLSAGAIGVGISLMAFAQTRQRYRRAHQTPDAQKPIVKPQNVASQADRLQRSAFVSSAFGMFESKNDA